MLGGCREVVEDEFKVTGESFWEMFKNLEMACFFEKESGGGMLAAARTKSVGVSLIQCVSIDAESLSTVLILSRVVLCRVIQAGAA